MIICGFSRGFGEEEDSTMSWIGTDVVVEESVIDLFLRCILSGGVLSIKILFSSKMYDVL